VTEVATLKKNAVLWQLLCTLYQTVSLIVEEIAKMRKVSYSMFAREKTSKDKCINLNGLKIELGHGEFAFLAHLSPFYVVELFKLWHHSKQLVCDTYGFHNMWILKPAGVSRGSGISITSDILKIAQLKYGKIVQKYIENPLLLNCKRKFDIRQWILVKSFNPLRAFAFKKCYARLSSMVYSAGHY
jgi:hypothetical protein